MSGYLNTSEHQYQQVPSDEKLYIERQHSSKPRSTWKVASISIISLVTTFVLLSLLFQYTKYSTSELTCQEIIVRREWRTLTDSEKLDYISSVQCLKSRQSLYGLNQSLYDDFAYFHTRVEEGGHDGLAFLVWHRGFINLFESALKRECDYSGYLTYWDWTLDWQNYSAAPVWDINLGFGGDGAPGTEGFRGRCLREGPFAGWEIPFIEGHSAAHCLSRELMTGDEVEQWTSKWKPEEMEHTMSAPDYSSFVDRMEFGPHVSLPHLVHGDFSIHSAPADPLFYLHHTQLDRLWWLWQKKDRSHLYQYGDLNPSENPERQPSLSDTLFYDILGKNVSVKDLMDTEKSPLCYVY